jgi:hypothetical protein
MHDFSPFNNSNISNGNQANAFANSNLINQHLRPKSPISMQSPPMSPISRMPLSPKSPRQRYSSSLASNSNTSKSLNNQVGDFLPTQNFHFTLNEINQFKLKRCRVSFITWCN